MLRVFIAFLLILAVSQTASAQNAATGTTEPPRSAVVIPENQRPTVDSTLVNPRTRTRKRRRFDVMIVPAPPPGRSRQEMQYSGDSLARDPRRARP